MVTSSCPQSLSFKNVNCVGFNAVPCNGVLQTFQTQVNDVSQEQRTAWYMNRRNSDVNITPLYPWSRDIVATSNSVTSAKDLCTEPKGQYDPSVTRLGCYLYKSPINSLPPYNDAKCEACRTKGGVDCLNCGGVYE
jgi:hypothetical protein